MKFASDIRKKRGLTLSDMARALGVFPSNVAATERAIEKISIVTLIKLFEVSGDTAEQFLERVRKEAESIGGKR